jgi:hypothetical protein
MRPRNRLVAWIAGWTAAISAAHFGLNVDWGALLNERLPLEQRRLNVAYIPVT